MVEESSNIKDDPKGLGDIQVICTGLGVIQGQVHTSVSSASSARHPTLSPHAAIRSVCHLCRERILAGAVSPTPDLDVATRLLIRSKRARW